MLVGFQVGLKPGQRSEVPIPRKNGEGIRHFILGLKELKDVIVLNKKIVAHCRVLPR